MKKGDTFQHSFLVTESVSEGFIETFRDRNPLHTDQHFAQRYGFEKKVVHGNVLNGFLSYFVGECLPIKNVVIHQETIEYMKPVYLMDKLMLAVTVHDVFESVGNIELNFNFKNQRDRTVAKGTIQLVILT